MLKKIAALLAALCLCGAACAEELPFAVRHGNREEAKIAVTIDDCYDMDSLRDAFTLAQQYEVPVTVFPLGERIQPEDAELWQTIAASDWEIGSHTYRHTKIGRQDKYNLMFSLMKVQEQLDAVLGYHYPIRSVRPPFGNYTDDQDSARQVVSVCRAVGVEHLVLWDVSQTDPDKAVRKVQNGSILLFHARPKDVRCLAQLIPALQEKGFTFVTVSELLGFEPLATSTDLYVYDKNQYRQQ